MDAMVALLVMSATDPIHQHGAIAHGLVLKPHVGAQSPLEFERVGAFTTRFAQAEFDITAWKKMELKIIQQYTSEIYAENISPLLVSTHC